MSSFGSINEQVLNASGVGTWVWMLGGGGACAVLAPLYTDHTFYIPLSGSVHTFCDVGIFHILAVPGEADIAFSIDNDQAACSGSFGSEQGNCCCGGIAGCFSMSYEIGGAFGYQQAHEIFTIACAGNGSVVVRIEATTYEGRVAYTTRILVGMPPVEVAAARWPAISIATAPIVPCLSSRASTEATSRR